ncbi:hypothetical protein [Pseudenhygromyxa sp. WMMC2535]|uniref:hypothetical protein n=1 Tax=Pseudenhygromyxa sp. WMMC2535 TaxID=2712867 RepID=UPI001C3E0F8D|nr:hypothetical protein [Pseudenhygromyxa sp. WMMC2535]
MAGFGVPSISSSPIFHALSLCLLVPVAASLACKGAAKDEPGEQAAAKSPAADGESKIPAKAPEPQVGGEVAAAMTEHFVHAVQLEQAVIDGDLEAASEHARVLVEELPEKSLPEAWRPQLNAMHGAAKEAAGAEDLASAGVAAGRVMGTCGTCHEALGKGPSFAPASPVPEGEDTDTRMRRHQWAAQRMREGMIGPSDERWKLGAGAVSVAPPEPCPIPDAEVLDAETLKLRERIYEVGARALETEGADERAAVYGEYLTTCAGCHVGGC